MPKLNAIDAMTFDFSGDADLSTKIAPPYDVLDEGPKQALLAKDAHNIVAIDLPVTPPKTLGPDSAYHQAGETMRAWLASGVLKQHDAPALVAYEQVYQVAGKTLRRRGLFAALGVEEFNRKGGGIHRHELTIQGGLDDRSKLMEATSAQLSPIFGIFSDSKAEVAGLLSEQFEGREPDFHGVTSNDDVEHRCWLVTDAQKIESLQSYFDTTDVFIADGHHRYTTALNYAQRHADNLKAQTCLFVLVAAEDPGMIVLPTHRVMRDMTGFNIDELLEKAQGVTITETQDDLATLEAKLPGAGSHAMGLYDGDSKRQFMLTFDDGDPLAATHRDKPEVWRQLDVAILQHAIVDGLLRPNFGGEAVGYAYTAELDTMREMTDAKQGQLGVIMQATPLQSVMGVSLADEVMPAKSTFFYPKLATGLVVNPLG